MYKENFSIALYRDYLENAAGFEAGVDNDEFASSALASLGFDSLSRLEAAAVVQRTYGISLDDDEIMSAVSAQDFVDLINSKLS